jgi:polysaccharide biosynthesis/export protein
MNRFLIPLAVILIGLVGCQSKGPGFDPRSSSVPAAFTPVVLTNRIDPAWLRPAVEPYRLGPGDVIEIEMIGEAQARSTTTVGPDGKVYYSLLPGVSVWGLTLAETTDLLKNETAKYTRATPEPVIMLRLAASRRISILGSIPSPGVYPLPAPTTLLEAISTAGGIPAGPGAGDDGADLSRSFVLRDGHFIPVNFEQLLKRGDLSQNIYLRPDDLVFIRPANIPSIYIIGAVAAPNMVPYSRQRSSVAQAIIAAGGMLKYAQKTKVAIIRGGLTQPRIAEVDYQAIVKGRISDVLLEPGDIVYVPFSPFRQVAQLAESILDQFVRTVAVNEGQAIGSSKSQPVGVSSPFGFTPAP